MVKPSLQELLQSYIDNRDTVFVFPSAVPAQFWARRICEISYKPIALERFIAWDEFKEQCLSAHQSDRRPANGLSRMLFSSYILEKNARETRSGAPLFTELLPPSYAPDYTPFTSHISGMLPALKPIMEQTAEASFSTDPYLRDLRILFHHYSDFLNTHKLYEPDWFRSPFQDHNKHWILILPDLTDDWESYEKELSSQQSVLIVTIRDIQIDERSSATAEHHPSSLLASLNRSLLQLPSWREEIRYVANLLAHLVHNKTLPMEEIALSIPNLENYAEELSLECRLRGIPVSIRQGKAITDQSGGRLFSLLQDCYQTNWSYRALKHLLTDQSLPWKESKLIQQLLTFGLEYRCLSGYRNKEGTTDVWLETFQHILDEKIGTTFSIIDLKRFYQQLKRDISDIVTAKTFTELRTKLMLFAGNHFDRDIMSPETDKVYARSIEELEKLIATEEYLADCSTGKAFPLFLAHLKNTTYVHQSDTGGIAVYPYRVAAGITPTLHIVMNATQEGASVIVDPAPFLREDRKRSLEWVSRDRSKSFINAYSLSPVIIYTAADRGFTGHTIPHQVLTSANRLRRYKAPDVPVLEDSYHLEEHGTSSEHQVPYETQRLAWERSQQSYRTYGLSQDFRKAPINETSLRSAIYTNLTTKRAAHHISPTDINQFITCPHQWLLTRGLAISEPQLEIETIGQKEIGILYHTILEAFFNHIQSTQGKRIRASEMGNYQEILEQIIKTTIAGQRLKEGAFQESVYEMLFERIRENLFFFLTKEIPSLDSCSVLGPEYHLRRHYPELGMYLAGSADLLLMDNEGKLIIIDFKTNNTPEKRELWPDGDGIIANFQIAAYVRMAEDQEKTFVSRAFFYSIEQRTSVNVIDPAGPPRKNAILPVERKNYDPVLTTLDKTLVEMVDCLKNGTYPVVDPGNRNICSSCPVKAVCRINFSGGDKA